MQQIMIEHLESKHLFSGVYGVLQIWKQGESWSFLNNPRKDHGFMLVLCKQVDFLTKGGTHQTYYAGDLLSIPKHSEYYVQFWDSAPQQKSDILINFHLYDLSGQEYCLWPGITRIMSNTPPEIHNLFVDIGRLSRDFINPSLQISERFFTLLQLLRDCRLVDLMEDKSHRAVYKAIAYMETHICDPLTIPELAQLCAMSETGFRALFRQIIGMSPSQYRTQLKIEKAKSMLSTMQDHSIAEIGSRLGFCDTSYFTHIFTRHVGVSPGKYRQGIRGPDAVLPE